MLLKTGILSGDVVGLHLHEQSKGGKIQKGIESIPDATYTNGVPLASLSDLKS